MSYAKNRYIIYALITIITLVVPFITIDGNHLLLLSFDKFQFHLMGFAFNMNEFYVMPFLLMFLFIGVFVLTAMYGRLWCGWACPQTIFRVIYRDLIEGTLLDLRKISNKQKKINYSKKINNLKKALALFLWAVLSLVISINFMLYFVAAEDFFTYLLNPDEHLFMIMFTLTTAVLLFIDIVYIKENFCTYVCPYSRIQTVLYDDDTKHVVYDTNRGGAVYKDGSKSITNVKEWMQNEECTTCEACVKVCPTHIDIRKGLQLECINCLECSDACSTVMGKLGKKSLINWGSSKSVLQKLKSSVFSNRNNIYLLILLVTALFAIFFASQKEYLLVNINKTTQAYRISDNGMVYNGYIVAIHNTQKKAYTYDIELEDSENFQIKKFKSFKLDAKKRAKKVLIIESKNKLNLSDRQNTVLQIKLTVFAKEDPKIRLTNEIAFIYPRGDLVK